MSSPFLEFFRFIPSSTKDWTGRAPNSGSWFRCRMRWEDVCYWS